MLISFFERDYADLSDGDDASKVISVRSGVATIGDIRAACAGHSKEASIYAEGDASGFYVSDIKSSFFTA